MLDVSLNGSSMRSTFGIYLIKYFVNAFPGIKNKGIDISGNNGIFRDTNERYRDTELQLDVVVTDDTVSGVQNKVRNFVSWCAVQVGDIRVVFNDDPGIFRKVRLSDVDKYSVTKGLDNCMATMSMYFSMADPFSYQSEQVVTNLDVNSGRMVTIQNTAMSTQYVLEIRGLGSSAVEPPAAGIGSCYGIETSPALSNISIILNGVNQVYGNTLWGDETLKIDEENLTVYKDNNVDIVHWSGDMQDLIGGNNTLLITNAESANMQVVIKYYRRWL